MTKSMNPPDPMKSLKPFFNVLPASRFFLPRAWLSVPFVLSLVLTGQADAAPVQGARVTDMSSNTDILLTRPQSTSNNLQRGQRIDNRDLIEVPARSRSWAQLIAIGPSLQAKLIGLANKTTWQLPCTFSGTGFIAWSGGGRNGCSPPGVVIKGNSANLSTVPNQATLIASSEPNIGLPIAQVTKLFAACSATDEYGNNAKTAVSLLGNDPCSKAVQDCERAGGASSACVVVSEGQWRNGSVAFAQCGDRLRKFTTWDAVMGFGSTLFLGQSINNCVLHVLSPGDALLIAESGPPTAIAFEIKDQAAVVSVIEGAVKIVSRRSDNWTTVSSGETYTVSSGRQWSTRDWLPASELCNNSLGFNKLPVGQHLIASAATIAQVPSYSQEAGDSQDQQYFDRLQSAYCGSEGGLR